VLFLSAYLIVAGAQGDDRSCPPGTEPRTERTSDTRAVGCMTSGHLWHGPYVLVHANGVTLARGRFEGNQPVGRWETWYSTGQRHEAGAYEAGQRSGWWVRWHDNGQKKEEGSYRNGHEQGFWRAWDDQGRLISAVPRSVDCPEPLQGRAERLFPDLHPDPSADEGGHCRRSDGVRQGPAMAWWLDRKIAQIGSYCDGDAQGRWSFFWRNGVLAREGSFVGPSRKSGTWTDWDDRGRKLRETEYLDGKEVSRRDFPLSGPGADADPMLVDAIAVERYEQVRRLPCSAEPISPRPFRGLREELNAADAVLRIRATDVQTLDRPPGWDLSTGPAARQQIDAIVVKVLAGSLAQPGQPIRLSFAARENAVRAGVHKDTDFTALVKRDGDRLVLVTVMDANDVERTDAFFQAYARLARLDDGAFALGLAELLADRIRLAPDRLLWVHWAFFAFDDWDRLKLPAPPTDPRLLRVASETQRAILAQVDDLVRGGEGGPNLFELPWLIRLLSRAERREMAAGLLRMHPLLTREQAEATKAARPGAHQKRHPTDELTIDDVRAMGADAAMAHLVHCLAVCVDPLAPVSHPREEAVRRAREFVR
jgi:antitoxin component YwqK of YwqJK toxin-antitoxin module